MGDGSLRNLGRGWSPFDSDVKINCPSRVINTQTAN